MNKVGFDAGLHFCNIEKHGKKAFILNRNFMEKINLTVSIFCEIFNYGTENAGYLMFSRFLKLNSDIELFENQLCNLA